MSENQEAPRIVAPEEVQIGDVIIASVMNWGGLRIEMRVTGLADISTGRPESRFITPAMAVGTSLKEGRDGGEIIAPAGTPGIAIYWPNKAQASDDIKRVERTGDPMKARWSPVLIERQTPAEVGGDDDLTGSLAELEKLLGIGQKDKSHERVTLRSPRTLKGDPDYHDWECEQCDARPRWYYPKVNSFRCASHRDRSLQDPEAMPVEHETYVAWADDPMDAEHFA